MCPVFERQDTLESSRLETIFTYIGQMPESSNADNIGQIGRNIQS